MKKTINLGLVCLITLLLACNTDDGVRLCEPHCSGPPPSTSTTILTVHPSAGSVGDEVVVVVGNLPEDAVYDGKPFGSGGENRNSPWVSATVGDKSAVVLSVTNDAVTIQVPQFLEPGNYQLTLNIGSQAVAAPSKFEVLSPKL